MDHQEFISKSERLLFCEEFRELNDRLKFQDANLWHILGIGRKEDYVTKFLAWLMDPARSHGQRDLLLKSLLIEAARSSPGSGLPSPLEIELADLSSADVRNQCWLNEHRRCDLVITCRQKDPRGPGDWLILIENKVGAKEGPDQTSDYYTSSFERYSKQDFPRRIYLFLSPDGAPAKSTHFVTVSYETLLTSLAQARARCDYPESARFLVSGFEETIRRYVAMDRETLDLAQAIYEKYRDVIDFIYQNSEPEQVSGDRDDWDGKSYFFNIGETGQYPYSWEECKRYGFICAGGGPFYAKIMQRFRTGDVIYAYLSKFGYVGIGSVQTEAVPFAEAKLADGSSLQAMKDRNELTGKYDPHPEPEKRDWVVLVRWNAAVDKVNAVRERPAHVGTCARFYTKNSELMEKIRSGLQSPTGCAATA